MTWDIQELQDRNAVPADKIDHLNILRYEPRDPPTVGIFDEPTRCYKVNQEWAKHIMGAVSGLTAWKAWTGAQDELNEAVQSIMEFMVGEVCSMFLLRQNSETPCLLEQSIDGGTIWTTAFDFSLCAGGGTIADIAFYIDIAIVNIENLNIIYIDAGLDIIIVYPNLEYDAGPEDADRDTALCYSIQALTDGLFNAVEDLINQQLNRTNFLSALIASLSGGFWASSGSLLQALSQSVTDVVFGTDALQAASDALGNTFARAAVVCCIYENMRGETATFARWNDAGDSCGFSPTSDEQLLLDILTPLFAGLDAYLSWITLVSSGVDLAIADTIGNNCITCAEWIADIDFTTVDGGFALDGGLLDGETGEWVTGVGWRSTTELQTERPELQNTAVVISLSLAGMTSLGLTTMTYDYVQGGWTLPNNTLALRIARGTNNTNVVKTAMSDGTDQDQVTAATFEGSNSILLFLRSSSDDAGEPDEGEGIITRLQIEGVGAIPTELLPYIV